MKARSCAPFAQGGQAEHPLRQARVQVGPEPAGADQRAGVARGGGDQLEPGGYFDFGPDGAVAPGFDHLQKGGLFLRLKFVDLVEEQHPAIGLAQEAGPFAANGPGRGTALAEERGRGALAAQGGAVGLHQPPLDAAAEQLQFVDIGGEGGFACAGLTQKQDRRVRSRGNQIQPFGQRLHRGAGGLDAAQ